MARRNRPYITASTLRPPASQPARGKVRRRWAAEAPTAVLVGVALVSLLLHIGLGVVTYNLSLGQMIVESADEPPRPLRVRQATFDLRFDPLTLPGQLAERRDSGPTLEQLSEMLLAQADMPPEAAMVEQDLDLRSDIDEARPEPDVSDFAGEVGDVGVPDDVWRSLAGDGPEDLAYSADAGAGVGAGRGGDGDGDGEGGGGRGEAQRLLADAGLPDLLPPSAGSFGSGGGSGGGGGGGGGLALPESDGPSVELGVALDDRLLDMPLVAPEIDFAGMALDATTRLEIPTTLDDDFDFHLTRLPGQAGEAGYFRLDITPRPSLRRLSTMPKDVIFLLDLSSPTAQRWARELAGGIRQSLSTLHEGDRFNIVLLADEVAFFSGRGPLPATREHLDEAREFLDEIQPARRPLARISGARSAPRFRQRMLYHIPEGQADLEAALSRLLVRDLDAQRVHNLVLISEGRPTEGVIEPRELINLITRDNAGLASIYAIGVGTNADRTLLEFLAHHNRGHCLFAPRQGDVAGVIRALASQIRYPLVRDVQFNLAGSHIEELYPRLLPVIHHGQRLTLFGRYRQGTPFTLRFTGTNMGSRVDLTVTPRLAEAPVPEPGADRQLPRDWAFWKLHHLYSEILHQGERPQLLQQIHTLRSRYDLQTLY